MGCLRGSPTTPTSSKTSTGRRRLAPPLTTGASGNKVGRISTICFDSKSGTSLPISHLMVCKMVCKRLLARESSRPPHDQHALSPAKTHCRAGGIRTHDPLTPSQVRYQAALQPATSLRTVSHSAGNPRTDARTERPDVTSTATHMHAIRSQNGIIDQAYEIPSAHPPQAHAPRTQQGDRSPVPLPA